MIEALLFDLGGVVIDVDFARVTGRWAEHAQCDPDQLSQRFRLDDDYARHERGAIDASAYFAALRISLGIGLSDDEFLDGWNAIFGGVIAGIEPLLADASARLPLFLFSNTNPTHERYWTIAYKETLKPFRRVFTSCGIGQRKPDREAFALVAQEMGVPPERILFFDDSAANVAGARESGLQAVQVRSIDDVAVALSRI